jgi:hypothetical protein
VHLCVRGWGVRGMPDVARHFSSNQHRGDNIYATVVCVDEVTYAMHACRSMVVVINQ